MSGGSTFTVTLEQREGYQFDVTFDDPAVPALRTDEPPPVGDGVGPNPVRLLGAAVGNCLAASLAFCLQKSRAEAERISARVEGTVVRNESGRLRVGSLRVIVQPHYPGAPPERAHRCTELFEDFCIVTGSVREGIDIAVEVQPVVGTGGGEGASAGPE